MNDIESLASAIPCTIEQAGLTFDGPGDSADADAIRLYFAQFADPRLDKNGPHCICGKPLLGLLCGTFNWGITHGEGYCGACKHPVRAYHCIKLPEGEIKIRNVFLPYLP